MIWTSDIKYFHSEQLWVGMLQFKYSQNSWRVWSTPYISKTFSVSVTVLNIFKKKGVKLGCRKNCYNNLHWCFSSVGPCNGWLLSLYLLAFAGEGQFPHGNMLQDKYGFFSIQACCEPQSQIMCSQKRADCTLWEHTEHVSNKLLQKPFYKLRQHNLGLKKLFWQTP